MKVTEDVPVVFGTMTGDKVGYGRIEEGEQRTVVTVVIDHGSAENIVDLLKHQLMAFAMVVRPGIPTSLLPEVEGERNVELSLPDLIGGDIVRIGNARYVFSTVKNINTEPQLVFDFLEVVKEETDG